jgi:hypothetical protein
MQVMDVNSATHFGSKRAPYLIIGFFLFATESRLALGPTQPPIQWVPEALLLGCEANHSPPSNA